MKDLIRSELKIWAQYFVLALLAGWIVFVLFIGSNPGINVHEAWRNYEPEMRYWIIILGALGAIRFLLIFLLRKLETKL